RSKDTYNCHHNHEFDKRKAFIFIYHSSCPVPHVMVVVLILAQVLFLQRKPVLDIKKLKIRVSLLSAVTTHVCPVTPGTKTKLYLVVVLFIAHVLILQRMPVLDIKKLKFRVSLLSAVTTHICPVSTGNKTKLYLTAVPVAPLGSTLKSIGTLAPS